MEIQRGKAPNGQRVELHTVDAIQEAVWQDLRLWAQHLQSHGGGVYCTVLGWTSEVVDARQGTDSIEVQTPNGDWVIPGCVYRVVTGGSK